MASVPRACPRDRPSRAYRERMADDEVPRDPFLDDVGGPWGRSLSEGDLLFKGLTELPNVVKVIVAVKGMSREDLERVVVERVASWHVQRGGMFAVEPWLHPPKPDS
jgi:hypothetical protein